MKNRWLKRILIGLLVASVLVYLVFTFSPWPKALIIRAAFNKEADKTNERLARYLTGSLHSFLDESFDDANKNARLDVYIPDSAYKQQKKLPAIIWIHGGGLISGNKKQVSNYAQILAAKGFTVIAIDYSIAPESNYPQPVKESLDALAYIVRHAERFCVDTSTLVLAGDSGGAHVAAQVAAIVTDAQYANLVKLKPKVSPSQLIGLVLYCGPYNLDQMNGNGSFSGFIQTVMWAYSGKKNFSADPYFQTASILNYLGPHFPASFISAGNKDPLLSHSLSLSRKLVSLGVPTDSLFFPANHEPGLPHEYQFNLDLKEGQLALEKSVLFIQQLVKKRQSSM